MPDPFYFPPADPYVIPHQPFDGIINAYGVRLTWQKSHLCPCIPGGAIPGSPDPECQQCLGRGWYWDDPSDPFMGLITFIHLSPTPDEPGMLNDPKFGFIERSEPTITIPITAATVYAQAGVNDVYTQIDAVDRQQATLISGKNEVVPYQQNLTIETEGAVTVYDPLTHQVTIVSGYTVSGATVTLPSSYAPSTPYIVDFTAAKAFVAYRNAGAIPHDRPFGQVTLPKRFRLQQLDLWLRGSGKI